MFQTVLKYKNSPSFINRRTSEGGALYIATKKNKIQIVELLLSIPEINVNAFDANRNVKIVFENR